ncbi:toll/interleukin-1 receptor domain-containing protein [Paenibacillus kandeliae]|uniref:toll/interleukin-1 receptor domain-containing protein n=1 Tax=Paenibacillus kandeliae TaxID=3231269 RepID=UPI003459D9EB
MDQDFIIEFNYFENRNLIFEMLGKLADKYKYPALKELAVYINNIPSNLELYVHMSYSTNEQHELQEIKEKFLGIGIYRPDLSSKILFYRIGDRGFDYISINDSLTAKLALYGFWYNDRHVLLKQEKLSIDHIQRLKEKGYNAFEKIKGDTTIFLSHSSKQKQELEKIIPYFTAINELSWLDKFRLAQNANIEILESEIISGLQDADIVLFYITKDFLESKWCKFELDMAINIKRKKEKYYTLMMIREEIREKVFSEYSILLQSLNQHSIIIVNSNQNINSYIGSILNKLKEIRNE